MNRSTCWKLRTRTLEFAAIPSLMGIVNVTPDSFSDGGRFYDPSAAVDHAITLADAGAAILDVGGESTRPYADVVSDAEELRRILPVIEQLKSSTGIPISIDTMKPTVAREALAAGAEIINDVSGFRDVAMAEVALETGAGVCVMHMQGTPQTMQDDPQYVDVVADIHAHLAERRDALIDFGIEPERICLDPGIGFGKTHQHNILLASKCDRFHDLGCPLLVGHSRKGFIAKLIGDSEADRTAGTIGVAIALAVQGVQVIRVHDVAEVRHALLAFGACS